VTYLQGTTVARQFAKQFKSDAFVNNVGNTVANTCIDVLNRFSTGDWSALSSKFSNLSGDISNTLGLLTKYNNFLGLNIGNSPWFTFKNALAAGSILGIIAAILVPLLAAVTQLINVALMPQPQATSSDPNDQQSQMMNSMKTMNYMMPIMSAWFCATLPAGMGLYWIAGSVIRSIQQVGINKYINNMDMDAYIAKNVEKQKKKMEKNGGKQSVSQRILSQYSGMSTRNTVEDKYKVSDEEKKKQLENAQHYYESGKFRKGSLASKANMVNDFNNHKRDEQGKDNKN
jgi:YidC/Oxa1 family membrane protein insertase